MIGLIIRMNSFICCSTKLISETIHTYDKRMFLFHCKYWIFESRTSQFKIYFEVERSNNLGNWFQIKPEIGKSAWPWVLDLYFSLSAKKFAWLFCDSFLSFGYLERGETNSDSRNAWVRFEEMYPSFVLGGKNWKSLAVAQNFYCSN